MDRSYERITLDDLRRLGHLAERDLDGLFQRKPKTGALYRNRQIAVALCQGAALHFVDGKTGIKDFDVWSFFVENERPFPYRRRGTVDFGDPKLGQSPGEERFVGRRVDLIGRSLRGADQTDPIGSLQIYLSGRNTKSASFLAEKAVVLIKPSSLLGKIIWPTNSNHTKRSSRR